MYACYHLLGPRLSVSLLDVTLGVVRADAGVVTVLEGALVREVRLVAQMVEHMVEHLPGGPAGRLQVTDGALELLRLFVPKTGGLLEFVAVRFMGLRA